MAYAKSKQKSNTNFCVSSLTPLVNNIYNVAATWSICLTSYF